jgi:hypothetical protein
MDVMFQFLRKNKDLIVKTITNTKQYFDVPTQINQEFMVTSLHFLHINPTLLQPNLTHPIQQQHLNKRKNLSNQ